MAASPQPDREAPALITRLAWPLGLLLICAAAITWVAHATRERIAGNESAQIMHALNTVLPAGSFDNHPDQDRILVTEPKLLGSDGPLPLYRVRQGDRPVAAVITAIARQGYVGPIRLLVALGPTGHVLAVRVMAHQETPGLGDGIDADKSAWITAFASRSLTDPDLPRWAVRRDGGQFDQLTGTTITSRAVVNAVRDAALYFEQHQADILTRPPE